MLSIDELLDKKLCVLCHQFPMGTGVICDNCRYDKKRASNIIDKKLKRMQAEKIEKVFEDFKNNKCVKCHTQPSLETMPFCVDCARTETFGDNIE